MAKTDGKKNNRVAQKVRAVLIGPHLIAFVPALALVVYWYGGEGLLLYFAIIFPAVIGATGVLTKPSKTRHDGRDPVTGLVSRESVLQALNSNTNREHGEKNAKICLVLELDDSTSLRLRFGDDATDRILRQSTARLLTILRPSDVIGSLAEGRFAIVLNKTSRVDLEAMIQLSNRLQSAVSEPISVDKTRVLITSCVGFTLPSRLPNASPHEHLNAALAALYAAQHAGPGAVRVYTKDMRVPVGPLDNATKEVVRALETGQILPWFQPQISTDSGAVTGFEALARWQHPQKGLIAPAAFLPAIAQFGMFERLGEVMLFNALTALRKWDESGQDVPTVSVNISLQELQNPAFCDKIRWELDRFEMSPERLVLEILEDVVAQPGDDTVTRNITVLSDLGCGIDLDDFGTGNASIANIRRFDVNRIKIDRSFVTHVDTDRDQQNMISAILTMAERLEVDTIAEGVESVGEHVMLAQLGCAHVQGYSIARPMPFEKTAAWLTEHRHNLIKAPALEQPA